MRVGTHFRLRGNPVIPHCLHRGVALARSREHARQRLNGWYRLPGHSIHRVPAPTIVQTLIGTPLTRSGITWLHHGASVMLALARLLQHDGTPRPYERP